MCREASGLGANAIIAMRYDATELMTGLTEVLCYGTAVMVRRDSEDGVEEEGCLAGWGLRSLAWACRRGCTHDQVLRAGFIN
jgi:hypothetical protein